MQWYGAAVAEFQTVDNSFLSLWSMVRGSTEFSEAMMATSRGFTVVFTTSFVVVVLFIYAFMLATLINTYSTVRRMIYHYSPTNRPDYEMSDFMMKQIKKWLGVTKPKTVGCQHLHWWTKVDIISFLQLTKIMIRYIIVYLQDIARWFITDQHWGSDYLTNCIVIHPLRCGHKYDLVAIRLWYKSDITQYRTYDYGFRGSIWPRPAKRLAEVGTHPGSRALAAQRPLKCLIIVHPCQYLYELVLVKLENMLTKLNQISTAFISLKSYF